MPKALLRSLTFMRRYARHRHARRARRARRARPPTSPRRRCCAGSSTPASTDGSQAVVLRGAATPGRPSPSPAASPSSSRGTCRPGRATARRTRCATRSSRKLQRLSFSYHDRAQTGQLITRVTSDVDLVRDFVGGGLVSAVSAVLLLVGRGRAAVRHGLAARARRARGRPGDAVRARSRSSAGSGPHVPAQFQEVLGRLNSVLQENIAGIRVVKAFAREEFESARYERGNAELLSSRASSQRRTVANAFPLQTFVGSLGMVAVTWVGARAHRARASSPSASSSRSPRTSCCSSSPLFVIGFSAQAIARSGASAQRLFEVLDAENDVVETAGRARGCRR